MLLQHIFHIFLYKKHKLDVRFNKNFAKSQQEAGIGQVVKSTHGVETSAVVQTTRV